MVVSLDVFITKVLLHVNFILLSFLSGKYQTTFEFFHERDVLEKSRRIIIAPDFLKLSSNAFERVLVSKFLEMLSHVKLPSEFMSAKTTNGIVRSQPAKNVRLGRQ